MVRTVVTAQTYRAWSILQKNSYNQHLECVNGWQNTLRISIFNHFMLTAYKQFPGIVAVAFGSEQATALEQL